METDKRKLIYEGEKLLRSLLGTLIYAVGINMFVVPAKLYTSGLQAPELPPGLLSRSLLRARAMVPLPPP